VARRGTEPEEEPILRVPRSQLDAEIGRQLELGEKIASVTPTRSWDELNALESQLDTWDEFNEELLRRRFTTGKVADDYKRAFLSSSANPTVQEGFLRNSLAEQMRRRILMLALSAAVSTARAWSSVNDLDGRPARPAGMSHKSTTFLLILSRFCACLTARLRIE
jgi:hypothetical protein